MRKRFSVRWRVYFALPWLSRSQPRHLSLLIHRLSDRSIVLCFPRVGSDSVECVRDSKTHEGYVTYYGHRLLIPQPITCSWLFMSPPTIRSYSSTFIGGFFSRGPEIQLSFAHSWPDFFFFPAEVNSVQLWAIINTWNGKWNTVDAKRSRKKEKSR